MKTIQNQRPANNCCIVNYTSMYSTYCMCLLRVTASHTRLVMRGLSPVSNMITCGKSLSTLLRFLRFSRKGGLKLEILIPVVMFVLIFIRIMIYVILNVLLTWLNTQMWSLILWEGTLAQGKIKL